MHLVYHFRAEEGAEKDQIRYGAGSLEKAERLAKKFIKENHPNTQTVIVELSSPLKAYIIEYGGRSRKNPNDGVLKEVTLSAHMYNWLGGVSLALGITNNEIRSLCVALIKHATQKQQQPDSALEQQLAVIANWYLQGCPPGELSARTQKLASQVAVPTRSYLYDLAKEISSEKYLPFCLPDCGDDREEKKWQYNRIDEFYAAYIDRLEDITVGKTENTRSFTPTTANIKERIFALLEERKEYDDVTVREDAQIASIDDTVALFDGCGGLLIEFILALTEEFDIAGCEDELSAAETVADLITIVRSHV